MITDNILIHMRFSMNDMQAIYIVENGGPQVLQLQNRPKPVPKKGEALVKLKRAGLNFIDIYMRMGNPAIPFTLPFIPGVEGCGIVEEIGADVSEVKPGDRVAYVGHLGAYAEYSAVPAAWLIPLREEINFDQGGAFPLQGMTSHYLVHEFYPVKPGDNVLVHAAAGGVGLLAVQWLKHLGARVIGTVSTIEKAQIAREAGADEVIIYTEKDFAAETKKLTNGIGADYIIDGVGKSTLAKDLDAVRKRGCICIFGLSSGAPDPIEAHKLQLNSIMLCGGNLMNYLTSREELLRRAEEVMKGIIEGWLKLKINHVFPLNQAGEAQHLLESRQTTGKLLLKTID
jgi:NADPH2:quinone reductase